VKKPAKHKKTANTNPQVASNETPAVSAIGTLSTGDSPNVRQQADASIESTEKSLNGISRKLDDQEQKTAAQIREYIKEAREALTAGDADGARNLAIKAKALLDELHP
jgi:ribosomal protein S20